MKLSELGEFNFLKKILKLLDENPLGKFDDAVAIEVNDKYLIINIDTLVRETDVPKNMTPKQIGRKIVVMSSSDVIAKGGRPDHFLVSITSPGDINVTYLEEVEAGIKEACKRYGIKFYGGDLNEGSDLIISGVSLGFAKKIVSRKGARVGETVWVTGEFGETGAGLHYILLGGVKTRNIGRILKKVFEPELPILDGSIIAEVATSSIDSSDGLAISLYQLSQLNNVKIVLEEIPIPEHVVDYAKLNGLDPKELALYGGEEFEIIFTTNLSDEEVIEKFKAHNYREPYKIGVVVEGSGVEYGGQRILEKGWIHFVSGGKKE